MTSETKSPLQEMLQSNPHLAPLKVDYLYHLGLNTSMDLKGMFGDVKFVLMGGSPDRMLELITRASVELGLGKLIPVGCAIAPVGKHERYHLYKLGPIISVSHGMGMPSMSILLHEITKLMHYAGASDFTFIRVGTSGGLKVTPGTVVITTQALNGLLEPFHYSHVLGKTLKRPCDMDERLAAEIFACKGDIPAVLGKTMSTDDFYEGQARLDGYLCDYGPEDRFNFLSKCHEAGVRNIEMEAAEFAEFCTRAKVSGAVVCVAILDRLGASADQVTSTPEQLLQFNSNAISLVFNFIRSRLGL